jgi:hypothetical protein
VTLIERLPEVASVNAGFATADGVGIGVTVGTGAG